MIGQYGGPHVWVRFARKVLFFTWNALFGIAFQSINGTMDLPIWNLTRTHKYTHHLLYIFIFFYIYILWRRLCAPYLSALYSDVMLFYCLSSKLFDFVFNSIWFFAHFFFISNSIFFSIEFLFWFIQCTKYTPRISKWWWWWWWQRKR